MSRDTGLSLKDIEETKQYLIQQSRHLKIKNDVLDKLLEPLSGGAIVEFDAYDLRCVFKTGNNFTFVESFESFKALLGKGISISGIFAHKDFDLNIDMEILGGWLESLSEIQHLYGIEMLTTSAVVVDFDEVIKEHYFIVY